MLIDAKPRLEAVLEYGVIAPSTRNLANVGRHCEVELVGAKDASEFRGLGVIRIGGMKMRSGRRPMFCGIRSAEGVEFDGWRVIGHDSSPESLSIRLAGVGRRGGNMDWMVHEVRPRLDNYDWSEARDPSLTAELKLSLTAVRRDFRGRVGTGFRYDYQYQSDKVPIHQLLDRATWEPRSGSIGNEFWLRSAFSPCMKRFEALADTYSSEWYLPTAANPNVFQLLPWQTQLQGFTMTACDEGVLVTLATRVSHIRSLFEKSAGTDEIVHLHQHCGDLTHEFQTVPIEVLWIPGATTRADRFDLYHDVAEAVADSLHAEVGIRRDRVTTYGVIEEWGNADLEKYRERGLPKLVDAGVKTVFLSNHFANNMNVYGVSNMCCTVDWRVPKSVDESKLVRFCTEAKSHGVCVEMWNNTAVSALAWMIHQRSGREGAIRFDDHPSHLLDVLSTAADPYVRNASNAIEADHYSPVFVCLNLRDETVREHWRRAWGDAFHRIGITGYFLDSSFNLSSDKHHWIANASDPHRAQGATADQVHLRGRSRPAVEPPKAILTQYHAHLDLVREMQQIGYSYCGEDIGVFGVHRAGPSMAEALLSLPLWTDCLAEFDAPAIRAAGGDPYDLFFRGLACRMMWRLFYDVPNDQLSWSVSSSAPEHRPLAAQLELLKTFNQTESLLHARTLLADDAGVIYTSGDHRVLWSYRELYQNVPPGAIVRRIRGNSRIEVQVSGGAFAAEPHCVYVIEVPRQA